MSNDQEPPPPTIPALKSTFLTTQLRLLAQPLTLPPSLRQRTTLTCSDATLDDVLRETNRLLRRHGKAAYDALAVRNVAEQIDALYWAAGEPGREEEDEDEDGEGGAVRRMEDLAEDGVISRLQPDFSSSEEYAELYERLQSLAARRAALRTKLASYRRLQERLLPLKDPARAVQPNLATREGPLEQELAKMRSLGIRVGSRVAGMKRGMGGGVGEEVEEADEREKVRRLLTAESV